MPAGMAKKSQGGPPGRHRRRGRSGEPFPEPVSTGYMMTQGLILVIIMMIDSRRNVPSLRLRRRPSASRPEPAPAVQA